ncbi:MAG: TIM barrel protein [Thermodesulfobacteriota bacterium]|nr:TIM barrel protein [Thermodesulfobacteriota bacterium]
MSLHSICHWTFNPGKGGFTPGNMRPAWDAENMRTVDLIRTIREKIAPRLPKDCELGLEMHYAFEANEDNAAEIAAALKANNIHLAMISPGQHAYYAYGGMCSMDKSERAGALDFCLRALDLTYGDLRSAWHPQAEYAPTFVIWNGAFGYDLASTGIQAMYQNMKESLAAVCRHEKDLGEMIYIGLEPKPNEGHPAMLLPTVASALLVWHKIAAEFGIDLSKKGINKEFGHSEMLGLDIVHDTVEELDNTAMVHMHVNSQGCSDGIRIGGPGKFDIDYGTGITAGNITMAALIKDSGYKRWHGHDMQARAYDNEEQALDRIVRSILNWEACERAATRLNRKELEEHLAKRDTAKAEDMLRAAVMDACKEFDLMYT